MPSLKLTVEELQFLKSLLLGAQFKAEQVPPEPWKAALPNNPRRISELWDKLHLVEYELTKPTRGLE